MTIADQARRLEVKLAPARIRATLEFAGLFQLTQQMIKSSVLDDLKSLYGHADLSDGTWLPASAKHQYDSEVCALDPKNRFRASLLWLQAMDAITETETKRLDDIYAHRHQLTHELGAYLVDPGREPDFDLFIDALRILGRISRFWTEVEVGLGTFDEHGPDLDDVIPGRLVVLQMCLRAYTDGLGMKLNVLDDLDNTSDRTNEDSPTPDEP